MSKFIPFILIILLSFSSDLGVWSLQAPAELLQYPQEDQEIPIESQKSRQIQSVPYDQIMAENLCHLSVAAYCNPSKLADWSCKPCQTSKIKLGNVQTFKNNSGDVLGIIGTSSQYKAIMIVFRGTVPWDLKSWISDIDFIPMKYPNCDNGCKVHEGFYKNYVQVQGQILELVDYFSKNYKLSSIIIAGHSLGGALATLAAADLLVKNKIVYRVYTFGSPRVGDPKFLTWFSKKFGSKFQARVTHGHDPVPHLPPIAFGFRHVPTEIFYETKWEKGYKICEDQNGEDPKCSNQYNTDVSVLDHTTYFQIDFAGIILSCQ